MELNTEAGSRAPGQKHRFEMMLLDFEGHEAVFQLQGRNFLQSIVPGRYASKENRREEKRQSKCRANVSDRL